jgi:hypothetical protein
MDLHASMRCLGQCGGIRCPSGPTRLSRGYLNIIKCTVRAIISSFIVEGLFSQPLIC